MNKCPGSPYSVLNAFGDDASRLTINLPLKYHQINPKHMTACSRTGVRPRRTSLAIAAALIASLMLISPTLIAADTDASFTKDEAGCVIKANNPTESELEKYNISKMNEIESASEMFTKVFNVFLLGKPEMETVLFSTIISDGRTIESEGTGALGTTEIATEGLRNIYAVSSDGDLINPLIEQSSTYYQQAAAAIKAYLGDKVSEGDRIIVTGGVNQKTAYTSTYSYAAVDSSHSVKDEGCETLYCVQKMDVKIELSKAGETDGKSIQFVSNIKFMMVDNIDFDYKGAKYSDLTPTSPCRINHGASSFSFESGSAKYIVDGKEYPVKFQGVDSWSEETTADIWQNSDVNLKEFKNTINNIPASSGNVTVSKGYHDAEQEFGEVIAEVVEKTIIDLFMSFLVPIIVILAIFAVIIIVVLVVIVKKH